jgi:large subunit ribosomal protein L18
MDHQKSKRRRQLRRRQHVRRNITGTAERPRLSVFRSSKHIYAQLIDDLSGVTLAMASSTHPDGKSYGGNVKAAQAVGKKLAEVALQKGITKAAFDRGHYRFHGRVKALAVAANAAGLKCSDTRKPPSEAPAPAPEKAAPAKVKKEKEKGKAAPAPVAAAKE